MGGGAYGRHIVPRRAADVLGGASGLTTGTGAAGQTALGRPERLTPKAGCSTSITMEVCDESAEVGVDWDLAGAHPARQRRRGAGRPGVLPPGKGRLKAPGSDIVPRRAAHLARRGTFASLRRTDQEEALGKDYWCAIALASAAGKSCRRSHLDRRSRAGGNPSPLDDVQIRD